MQGYDITDADVTSSNFLTSSFEDIVSSIEEGGDFDLVYYYLDQDDKTDIFRRMENKIEQYVNKIYEKALRYIYNNNTKTTETLNNDKIQQGNELYDSYSKIS